MNDKPATPDEAERALFEAWALAKKCDPKALKGHRNYGGSGVVCAAWAAWQAALAAPRPSDPAAGRWISVDERLPEPDSGEVLVWLTGGRCAFDEWHACCEDPTGMGGPTLDMGLMWRDYEFDEVTHWQPLPEPPPAAPGGQAEARGTDGQGG